MRRSANTGPPILIPLPAARDGGDRYERDERHVRDEASHAVIRHAWYAGRFKWALSTDILQEYEEVLGCMRGAARAEEILSIVMELGSRFDTVLQISPSFFFRTISADRDDDKFADCAIAADADYIITSDKHFAALIGSGYKPQPITPEEFIAQHLTPAP